MVSTTSLADDLKVTIRELSYSDCPEDRQLAKKAHDSLKQLVDTLRPVLHYVTTWISQNVQAIQVAKAPSSETYCLGIKKNGDWVTIDRSNPTVSVKAAELHIVEAFVLQDIVDGLTKAFHDAEKRKEQHLASVAKRTQMLDGIQALIKGSATQTR